MSESDISIRSVVLEDASDIATLCKTLGYAASVIEVQKRLQLLQGANHLINVAAVGGRIVGWIHARHSLTLESDQRIEIAGLVVAIDSRRRGIGARLVVSAEAWARAKGIRQLAVRCNAARIEAHAFYPALGFDLAKTQHVYNKQLQDA